MTNIFSSIGLPAKPIMLAPLAGVSDSPFRKICAKNGADLTYVEMLSATALVYGNAKTFGMMAKDSEETNVGVQITGRNAEEVARAVEIISREHFVTIDINMGCPVKKVVATGCGSAILRDPERVYTTTRMACEATHLPISAKIRLGWDHGSKNYLEVADAIEKGGAKWLTVHGRTRSDDYSAPVDLFAIKELKQKLKIPVIGNGNVLNPMDAKAMLDSTDVDGLMVSRGALGNPWLFHAIRNPEFRLSREQWYRDIKQHMAWQLKHQSTPAVCMRKHLLWYLKGWPDGANVRRQVNEINNYEEVLAIIDEFYACLVAKDIDERLAVGESEDSRFTWEPKYEMDREHDRAVF